MHRALSENRRRVTVVEDSRRRPTETGADFRSRISEALRSTGAQIAWLCLPPVPDVPLIVEAALLAGLHVVAEKPWLHSTAQTEALIDLAKGRGAIIAVHHQYCFLDRVQEWRQSFHSAGHSADGLKFSGRFTLSRPDRQGISALWNLGSHLLAIREYAVPESRISEINCGYDVPDERNVRIENESRIIDSIDFMSNSEPIIQRFIADFEASLTNGDFGLDLRFALRVAVAIRSIE